MTRQAQVTRTVVTLAVLIAAAALVVRGSFHRAARFATPSALHATRGLSGSRVRLVGVVRPGSIRPRANGVRFAIRDRHGTQSVVVHYSGDTSDELRGGGLVEVTGTLRGRAFEAQPSTLAAFCSGGDRERHC